MNFEKEILKLRRQVLRTRVGGVVAFASFAFGIHHLGNKHHKTFETFYEKHKTPREPWRWQGLTGWPGKVPWSMQQQEQESKPEKESTE